MRLKTSYTLPALCLAAALSFVRPAASQEIEPFEFVPLPAGTNLAIGYYVFGHGTEFNVANGPTFKNSKINVSVGIARYVHYFDVFGHPAGVQVIQGFGLPGIGANIGGQSLGHASGIQNTTLSAFIWPYVNTATKTNVIVAGFINVPDGSYDRHKPLNLGDNRLGGDIQLGWSQGLGDTLAFDAAVDAQFHGDNTEGFPGNRKVTQDTSYRLQLWATYRWSAAFTTSLGYEGLFGGKGFTNGFENGSRTDYQRIRANAALFLSPRLQTMLELNHDLSASGGFKQAFGATVRVLYVF